MPLPACGDVVARACHISIRASSWGLACRGDPLSRAVLPSFSSVVGWEPRGCKAGKLWGDGTSPRPSGWCLGPGECRRSALPDLLDPVDCGHRLLRPPAPAGKHTGVGSRFQLQGSGTQGSRPGTLRGVRGWCERSGDCEPTQTMPRHWGTSYTWGGVTCPPAWAALPGGAGGASVRSALLHFHSHYPRASGVPVMGGLISAILGGLGSLAQQS